MTDRESTGRTGSGNTSATTPPRVLDDEYIRTKLRQITEAQAAQTEIEAERTGATKTVSRLMTVFGSLITAAAIGAFAWIWNANATNATQAASIEVLETNPPNTHGHVEIEHDLRERERRVSALESSYAGINSRLDSIEREEAARHAEVLEELRALRGTRRTWGSP